ncbi:MAG: hypothetical protein IJR20_05365 [Muribaculaceae bacterium]|nr:hypothetical protein [Muribaculaceae bacterium]
MKKILLSIFCLFINNLILGQTQYDYYEDDVAHEGAVFDGYTIFGILIVAFIIFVIWLIYTIIKDNSERKTKRQNEIDYKRSNDNKKVIEDGGFICPICGKQVTDDNFSKHLKMFPEGNEVIVGYVKYCNNCDALEQEYEQNINSYYRKSSKKEMPDWVGCVSLIILLIVNIAAIVLGIIRKNDFVDIIMSMFGLSILSMLIMAIPYLLLNIGTHFQIKPKKPFETPSLNHIKKCNAIGNIQRKKIIK